MNSLSSSNIDYICDFIKDLCGIALDDSKSYLIDARLSPLMAQFQVKSAQELIDKAKTAQGDPVRKAIVEAITTRETFFFRDNSPFDALQFKALPETLDQKIKIKSNRLRIWSAAASTGQEACSIAMIIHEMIPNIDQWDVQIVATDISEAALEKARRGIYSKMEIDRGLPPHYVRKYFTSHPQGYKVAENVLRLIRHQQMNLLHPFRFPHQFDIIFCRNVAIYFEKSIKIDLFRRMLPLLPTNGYLFVGVSESLFDCGPEFRPLAHCKGTFYQPNLVSPATQASTVKSPEQLKAK